MKVAQEIDVDNVTIIINSENKLQAVGSEGNSAMLEFEDVPIVAKPDPLVPDDAKLLQMQFGQSRWFDFGVFLQEDFEDYFPQSAKEAAVADHFASVRTAPNQWILFTGLKKLKGTNLYLLEGVDYISPAKPKNTSA